MFLVCFANALADNTTVDDIENPEVGQIALDDVTFVNEETGAAITMKEIAAYSTEEKLDIINKYIVKHRIDIIILLVSRVKECICSWIRFVSCA